MLRPYRYPLSTVNYPLSTIHCEFFVEMAVTTQHLTLADYLNYDDGTNARYELVNGELVPMAIATGKHGAIMKFLERTFDAQIDRIGRDWVALQATVGIQSPRGHRWDTVRIPDVTILDRQQWKALQNCEAVVHLNEPPPFLVVEVVSETSQRIDYGVKLAEYNVLNIPEYWVVDPLQAKVTVFAWVDEVYEAAKFVGNDRIVSPTFADLELSVDRVMQGNI